MCSPHETPQPPDEEILAIVNDRDEVIGSLDRREIHRSGLRHRAVHILVFNEDRHLLLQKRAAHKDVNPGLWDTSAAGHVAWGESYEAAAKRELHEELGIMKGSLNPCARLNAEAETGFEFVEVFTSQHRGDLEPDWHEITELQWVPIEEINLRVAAEDPTLTRSFQKIWREVTKSCEELKADDPQISGKTWISTAD